MFSHILAAGLFLTVAGTILSTQSVYAAPDPNTCFGKAPTLNAVGKPLLGTDGDDVIAGTPGNDVIYGRGGNDAILGGEGDDVICGGAGHDALWGGDGDDMIYGGSGNDQLGGNFGIDTLYGGGDWDEIGGGPDTGTLNTYSTDNDIMYGDLPAGMNDPSADIPTLYTIGVGDWTASANKIVCGDKMGGGDGDDIIYGGDWVDITSQCNAVKGTGGFGGKPDTTDAIYGDAGDDTIRGAMGDDYIEGNIGNDIVYGGAGNDIVTGGLGNDHLFGGTGLDILTGGLATDSADCGVDTVIDVVSPNTETSSNCP